MALALGLAVWAGGGVPGERGERRATSARPPGAAVLWPVPVVLPTLR